MNFNKLIIQSESTQKNMVFEKVEVTYSQSTANIMTVRVLREDEYKIKFIADVTSLEIGTAKIYATGFVDTCRWKFDECTGIQKFSFTFSN